MTEHDHALETPDIRENTLSDRRNVMLTFFRTNKYKVGLNLLSNRLHAISKCIPKNCILQTKNQFKMFCKINLIQKGLLLLWIRLKHAIKLCHCSFHCLKIYQYQRSQFRSEINDFLKICIMLRVFVQMISHNKRSNQINLVVYFCDGNDSNHKARYQWTSAKRSGCQGKFESNVIPFIYDIIFITFSLHLNCWRVISGG